jgi:[protein-PII] uridylyltransferase
LVGKLARRLAGRIAVVALGAYGRGQLTPRAEIELLCLHDGVLTAAEVTQTLAYPMWERGIHVDPLTRTPDECAADARRSWTALSRLLDARLIAGDTALFAQLSASIQPFRRDRGRLRHRLRQDTQHRSANYPSATASNTPDLVSGRGGLLDLCGLGWLDAGPDPRTVAALDFLLTAVASAEDLTGHTTHRLSARVLQHLDSSFLPRLYAHARWVAFRLDSALAPDRDDRQLGSGLSLQHTELTAQRPPPLERAPGLGLRVANLVGLAPPSDALFDWASRAGPSLTWEDSTLDQFWLLLRAADWRAWEFLDVTGLLLRYMPELKAVYRQPGSAETGDTAVDTHSFESLRRLHEYAEGEDMLIRRAFRAARQRDLVHLAVLLHELDAESVASVVRRMRLSDAIADALSFTVSTFQSVLDTATRRDLHDEDVVLDLATRIGTRQRLGLVFLVAMAHEVAIGPHVLSPWKADLLRQLFGALERTLRQPTELAARGSQILEQRRERIVRALYRRNLPTLVRHVSRLPRRYVLMRPPEVAARHLALLQRGPLREGEVRIQASRHREPGLWDLLVVARDRPGLLATLAGVLALRGASVLAADAATSSDGLVLDIFTVSSGEPLQWPRIEADLDLALEHRIPLRDLLGSRAVPPEEAAATHVVVDNSASQLFSLIEVRAPDQVGLLYRVASALYDEHLDIQHARIATHPDGALDVFYVRTIEGKKLSEPEATRLSTALTTRLRGDSATAETPAG